MNETLIVVFTGVVAACTLLYMLITGWLAIESRRMRQAQTEPKVSVQLDLNDRVGNGGMELVICNEGMGPAQDIRFQFSGDPSYFIENGIGKPIDEVPVIKRGIRYLGTGRRFTIMLGWLFGEDFKRAMEHPWVFCVSYKSLSGKRHKDNYTLDFTQFSQLFLPEGDPLRKIEKHLDDIRKEFRHLGSGFHKLQVITHPIQGRNSDDQRPTKEEWMTQMSNLGIPVDFVETDVDLENDNGKDSE